MYQELFTNKYNINQIPCIFTDIDVFSIEVTEITPSAFVNVPVFSMDRQVKIQKQRQESDKKLLIGEELLILYVMSQKLPQISSMNACDIAKILQRETDVYGKPFFVNLPHIHFNVSHSGKYCVAAFSTSPVGIDVQEICTPFMDIADSFFNLEERNYLHSIDESVQPGAFYELWTLKESYVKAVGKGMQIPLDAVYEEKKSDHLFTIRCLSEPYPYLAYVAKDFDKEYRLSVCKEDPIGMNVH